MWCIVADPDLIEREGMHFAEVVSADYMRDILLRFCRPSKLAVMGTFLLAANYGWSSTAACKTQATLASFGVTAPTTGDGCYETDKTFSNFAVINGSSTGVGTGTNFTQSTSTIDIAGSDTFSSEKLNTPWSVSEAFTGVGSDFSVTGTGGITTKGTMSMLVNSTNAFLTNPSYPKPVAGATNFINTMSLSTSGTTGNANAGDDKLIVTETFCIGNAPCTATDEVILTATYGNNSSTAGYTCGFGAGGSAATADVVAGSCSATSSATPDVVQFSLNVTTVTVVDVYTLVAHVNSAGGGTTVTLNNFTDVFGEEELAPEPSTFILLGSALAGVAVLLRRKQSQRRP
jgi:hypothetical protein